MRRLAVVVAAVGAACALLASTPSQSASLDLSSRLSRALASPRLDARATGAVALDLQTGSVVFSRNAAVPLRPASVEKLAVTFAALRLLGPAYRFRTELVGSGERAGPTWTGNLVLVGSGDPSLDLADVDRLARRVAASGIRRVTGRVLGDETRFDARRDAPGWKPYFLGIESRPLSALSVAGARLSGPDSSALAAARALDSALVRHGVAVDGRPGRGRARTDALSLAASLSHPLASLVRHMNHESDNSYAELLLKELGVGSAGRGTTRAGARAVTQALSEAGVPTAGLTVADGSGLSLDDRVTSDALVGVLRAAVDDESIRAAFVGSLPVAGRSGTLERRLEGPATRGRVVAKTGTTRAACALAGFVRGRYVFAVVQNGSPVDYWAARAAQDRFVNVLARSE